MADGLRPAVLTTGTSETATSARGCRRRRAPAARVISSQFPVCRSQQAGELASVGFDFELPKVSVVPRQGHPYALWPGPRDRSPRGRAAGIRKVEVARQGREGRNGQETGTHKRGWQKPTPDSDVSRTAQVLVRSRIVRFEADRDTERVPISWVGVRAAKANTQGRRLRRALKWR